MAFNGDVKNKRSIESAVYLDTCDTEAAECMPRGAEPETNLVTYGTYAVRRTFGKMPV